MLFWLIHRSCRQKGGIRPHKRFSVQSNRSEVLFVDYIAEHLTQDGRAAVIVPEGIIFQSGNAYKQLRKMLVDKYLVGVISLPAGVFNPYSGVKTSILWLDKALAKKTDNILFVKISNDGFDLGAQRRSIKLNDIPTVLKGLIAYKKAIIQGKLSDFESDNKSYYVGKGKINENGQYNLSGERYKTKTFYDFTTYKIVEIQDICEIGDGNHASNYPKSSEMVTEGIPFIRGVNLVNGSIDENDIKFISLEKHNLLKKGHLKTGDVLITNRGEIGKSAIIPARFNNSNLNSQIAWLRPHKTQIRSEFLYR